MLVEGDGKAAAAKRGRSGEIVAMKENFGDSRVPFQHRGKGRLYENRKTKVGAPGVQSSEGRREHYHVAERPQANDKDFRALRKINQNAGSANWLQCGLRPPA